MSGNSSWCFNQRLNTKGSNDQRKKNCNRETFGLINDKMKNGTLHPVSLYSLLRSFTLRILIDLYQTDLWCLIIILDHCVFNNKQPSNLSSPLW